MTRLLSLRPKILILAFACLLAGGLTSLHYLGARIAYAGPEPSTEVATAPGTGFGSPPAVVTIAPAASVAVVGAGEPVVAVPAADLHLALILAAVGTALIGVVLIISALGVGLHLLARATNSAELETAAVDVDHVRDIAIGVVEELGLTPPAFPTAPQAALAPLPTSSVTVTNQASPPPAPVKAPQAGRVRLAVVVLLATAGSMGLGALSGCTTGQRQNTIHAALVTTDAARDGFLVYDQAHQTAIVAGATSVVNGDAKLAEYRAARAPVEAGFEAAYHALAVAALADDNLSFANAQAIVSQLVAAVQSLFTAGGK